MTPVCFQERHVTSGLAWQGSSCGTSRWSPGWRLCVPPSSTAWSSPCRIRWRTGGSQPLSWTRTTQKSKWSYSFIRWNWKISILKLSFFKDLQIKNGKFFILIFFSGIRNCGVTWRKGGRLRTGYRRRTTNRNTGTRCRRPQTLPWQRSPNNSKTSRKQRRTLSGKPS